MTIPTSDFSNVYNKDFLKKFYPQIVDELYTNSIISQFLHELEDFVLNDLVRPVNTKSNILLQIASYKYCYNALKDAFFREFK